VLTGSKFDDFDGGVAWTVEAQATDCDANLWAPVWLLVVLLLFTKL
jgi:hypothetical protein